MKYALVSPGEPVVPPEGPMGYRVAQVVPSVQDCFQVAFPLFWLECDDACVADQWFYLSDQIIPIPIKPIPT
jgi:hypothetical protein